MLCPEVWKFNAPSDSVTVSSGYPKQLDYCGNLIKRHYFNHNVSVVLPGCSTIPETLTKLLKDDCEYYKVSLPVSQLIERDFIDLFILAGELNALSVGTRIDVDDCVCLTPTGTLILSLTRETYQKLGVEGVPWNDYSAKPDRYAVTIDLKKDCFKPGKPNYDKVYKGLTKCVPLQFDFIIAWEPPPEKGVCPSSVAKFLHNKGYNIRLCSPVFTYKAEKNVLVPLLKSSEPDEIIEWLGAFSLGAFKKDKNLTDSLVEYLTTYLPPQECEEKSQVVMFQWTGFFTNRKINQLYNSLQNYIQSGDGSKMPWISLNVAGFGDAPVSWDLKHNTYNTHHDYHYTIFVQPDKYVTSYKVVSNNFKNQKKQKKWNFVQLEAS